VVLCTEAGDLPALIANKPPRHDAGGEVQGPALRRALRRRRVHQTKAEAEAAGVRIGTPVTYLPACCPCNGRIAGTSVDDRAGCAALLALAEARKGKPGPTLHLVWSVQEEYNLRGVLPAATALQPDIALQIDLLLACDTPDMGHGATSPWAAGRASASIPSTGAAP
jgi:putative aminopeptidase